MSDEARLAALSLVQTIRLIRLPVDLSVNTITEKFSGSVQGYKDSFIFLVQGSRSVGREFCKAFPSQQNLRWYKSSKGGPNGKPALYKPLEDFQAIRYTSLGLNLARLLRALDVANVQEVMYNQMSMEMLISNEVDSVKYFEYPKLLGLGKLTSFLWSNGYSRIVRFNRIYQNYNRHLINKDFCHSRIAFLPDKAGKTRVIALGDIFTQSLLCLVHHHVFSILRKIPSDGTFNQERQRQRVCEATLLGRRVYSIDMTACTDRLPAWFQADVLLHTGVFTAEQSAA